MAPKAGNKKKSGATEKLPATRGRKEVEEPADQVQSTSKGHKDIFEVSDNVVVASDSDEESVESVEVQRPKAKRCALDSEEEGGDEAAGPVSGQKRSAPSKRSGKSADEKPVDVQRATVSSQNNVMSPEAANILNLLQDKTPLKDAFERKVSTFVVALLAKRVTVGATTLLLRDAKHISTACELGNEVTLKDSFKAGVIKVLEFGFRQGNESTIMVLKRLQIVLEDAEMSATMTKRFGSTTRLVAGAGITRAMTIFELEPNMKNAEITAEIVSCKSKPWSDPATQRAGTGIFFTAKDVTGTIRGACFNAENSQASSLQVGAVVKIKNPIIKLAAVAYNVGHTTAFELGFGEDTVIERSTGSIRIEKIM